MKIVFNTRYPEAVASKAYYSPLSRLSNISFNDRGNYNNYDIALFMTYSQDLVDLREAKKVNPLLIIGLIDPRGSQVKDYLDYIDFFVVDSIEMRDFFAGYNKPIFTYYEYPDINDAFKKHKDKKPIIVGYHGNRVHLEGMYPNISKALEKIGNKYDIEFWAMYNLKSLGKFTFGIPKNVPVKHIQWSEKNYIEILSKVDIGIVPCLMPIRNIKIAKKELSINANFFNDSDDDYLIRFKMPTNPGRIVVFSKLGIPVISDMFPSAMQLINDGEDGLIAYSCGGWYRAIETLINNHSLRNDMSCKMRSKIKSIFDFDVQNEKFNDFINTLTINSKNDHLIIENYDTDLSEHKGFIRFTRKMKINIIKGMFSSLVPQGMKQYMKQLFTL